MPEKEFPTLVREAAQGLERKGKRNEHVDILLQEVENEKLTAFDGASVSLLQEVLKDKGKKEILSFYANKFKDTFFWLATHIGSKYVGYETGIMAGKLGKEYTEGKVSEYLSQALISRVREDIWGKIQERAQEVVTKPLIDYILAPLAGQLAFIPSAVGGYLGGSALSGGAIEVFREWSHAHGFKEVGDMIEASDGMVRDKIRGDSERDPRDQLIGYHDALIEDPKRLGYRLTNEEWLEFAGAVRRAKVDKLRALTRPPALIATEKLREDLTEQSMVVEAIISAQERITQADQEMAIKILSQFDTQIARDIEPVEKYINHSRKVLPKVGRYSKAFVRGGINATGIPFLLGITKWGIKTGVRIMSGGLIKL